MRTSLEKIVCRKCQHSYPVNYGRCPDCKEQNPRRPSAIYNPLRGTMAPNSRVDQNIERIVHFDQRYQQSLLSRDIQGLHELATWAEEQGLTLGRRALRAAAEMQA